MYTQRFNPRPRTGGDALSITASGDACMIRVSIRAPARGATPSARPKGVEPTECFNHGGPTVTLDSAISCFNPRPRTGGDSLKPAINCQPGGGFNPRPRTGGDPRAKFETVLEPSVSIRAPARGATRRSAKYVCCALCVFQSAPPHGGRRGRISERPHHRGRCQVSIRAPARGATWTKAGPDLRGSQDEVSIRAPARGATELPRTISFAGTGDCFNPRPRTGGDRGHSKRPEELRLAWSLREPCMVVDVTHPCNTFVSSQHLC